MDIEEIKQELKNILSEEYEFAFEKLKDYYETVIAYDLFRNTEQATLHPSTLLMASLSVNSPNTYHEKSKKIDEFIQKGLFDNFEDLSHFYLEFQHLEKKNREKVMQCFYLKGTHNLVQHLNTLHNETKEEDCVLTLEYLVTYLKNNPADLDEITPLMEMIYSLNPEEKESFDFFAYYSNLLNILEEEENFSIHHLPKEEADFLRKNYNAIVDKYRSLEKDDKQEKKEFVKRQETCRNLLKKLEHPFQGYLRLTENEIKYLPASILDSVENIYLVWNQRILERIQKELEIYNGNKEENLRKLFQTYSIPFFQKKEYISFLTNLNIEEVEEKLNFMKNDLQDFKEEELFVLLCMNMNFLKALMPYFITNMITVPFFVKHIMLFQNESVLEQMERNSRVLKSYSLNCKNFNEILLESDDVLEQNLKLIESYGLPVIESVVISSFLPHFFEVYHIWVEKGIAQFFLPNLSFMEKDLVGITKRILLCLELRIPVFDEKGCLNTLVTSQNKFFIEDEELNSYLDQKLVQKLSLTKSCIE